MAYRLHTRIGTSARWRLSVEDRAVVLIPHP